MAHHTLTQGDTPSSRLAVASGQTLGCPHVAHLRGRLTRKAKATVSRKLKMINLYNSSPTEFSQHCGAERGRPDPSLSSGSSRFSFLTHCFLELGREWVGGWGGSQCPFAIRHDLRDRLKQKTPMPGELQQGAGRPLGACRGMAAPLPATHKNETQGGTRTTMDRTLESEVGLYGEGWGCWPPGSRKRCSRRSHSWSCFCRCTAPSDPGRRRTSPS